MALSKMQKFREAVPSAQRIVQIQETAFGVDHPLVAIAITSVASLLYDLERYYEASLLFERALHIYQGSFGLTNQIVALSSINLAQSLDAQHHYHKSRMLLEAAQKISDEQFAPDNLNRVQISYSLGLNYELSGELAAAEAFYKHALVVGEELFSKTSPGIVPILDHLATVFTKRGRLAEARLLYERSLRLAELSLGREHPQLAAPLNNIANIYFEQGDVQEALVAARRLMSNNLEDKSVILPILFQAEASKLSDTNYPSNAGFRVAQKHLLSASGVTLAQLNARFASGDGELAMVVRQDQDLQSESELLQKNLIISMSRESGEREENIDNVQRSKLSSIRDARERLRLVISSAFHEYVALSKPQPQTIEQTQALLLDDEALVNFDFDARSYAWVITRTTADWTELKITAKDLTEQIKQLRQSLTFDVDRPFDASVAHKMYQETFGPVAGKIRGKKRLSVVANGALTSLPLQLLVTRDPSGKSLKDIDWLVRSYAITVLPSVYSLKTLRAQSAMSAAQKPIIAFADPVFSKNEHKRVAALRSVVEFYEGGKPDLVSLAKALLELPETETEVRAIADVLHAGKDALKVGADASETTVKNTKLDDYRIVYFATHALVAGEVEKFAKVKAEPALALTIPEKPTDLDDGLLTASEIAQLKLNADWVVLSACNTAAEDKPGAEALSGLARAFFYAGARSLVVSHWEVDSIATVKLMIEMFQATARDPKLSHAEALQQSILRFIDDAKSDAEAHPRFWAPFVVVGEPAKQQ